MKLEDEHTDELMAIAAFRYCLGRQSYIVGACLDWLRKTWPQFKRNTRHVIARDIVESLADGRAGSDYVDAPGWRNALAWMLASMDDDERKSLERAVEWKGEKAMQELRPNARLSG